MVRPDTKGKEKTISVFRTESIQSAVSLIGKGIKRERALTAAENEYKRGDREN